MNPVQHLLNTTRSSTTVLCTLSLWVAICCGLVCEWRVEVSMRGMAAPGDVLVAAFFPIHDHIHYTRHSLREPPGFHKCIDFNPRALRWALAMEFALREVNMNRVLLPNTTLGHIIHDSCYDRSRTIKALLQLTGWGQTSMTCRPHAVIGESGSTLSMEMARFLGHFHIPQISYFASCRCLSDKERFPSFLRSIPSDEHQSAAMASLVKHFHWGFVGTLEKDGEYGRNGVAGFLDVALSQGLCLAFREILPPLKDQKKFFQQGRFLSQTNAQVIVVFSPEAEFLPLVEQLLLQNVSGRTWMASEAWSTSRFLASSRFALVFTGTIGIALRQGTISGLSDFLKALRPRFLNRKNSTLAEGSEQIIKNLTRLCDGCTTNIMPPRNNCLFFPDMCSGDQDEVTYMTFAQMHMDDARRTRQKEADSSVFSLLSFKTMTNSLSPMDKHVLEQNTLSMNGSGLQKMYRPFLYSTNPTTSVAGVESETYRTTQTRLRLVPLQNNNTFRVKRNDRSHSELHGSVTSVVEGLRDDDLNEFLMELWHLAFSCTWRNEFGVTTCTGLEDLAESGVTIMDVSHLRVTYNVYMAVYFIAHALDDLSTCVQGFGPFKNSSCVSLSDFQPWQIPRSECNDRCKPGTRKSVRRGAPFCCYDCLPCSSGEFSNSTDSLLCLQCPLFFWSNNLRDSCVPMSEEFLSFTDPLAIALLVLATLGMVLTLAVTLMLLRAQPPHLLLLALAACFASCVPFVGRPTQLSCQLREPVACMCLTFTIARVLSLHDPDNSSKEENKGVLTRTWCLQNSHILLAACTIVQVTLCVTWTVAGPQILVRNTHVRPYTIIVECAGSSSVWASSAWSILGLLDILGLILSWKAHKSNMASNDLKFMNFSMLVCLLVHLTFLPAYNSTRGKLQTAAELVVVMSSAFGLIGCLFLPKVYVLFFK